ncbi:preprotein translocase, SecY subunit [Methanocaldococcus vulcanius M7]|uniref:Protein translocase subunit SecY n=1 Tax=Methanocaldococcus vulcanius (strain ATCC 700851 / DSM 12094 / M7) TaxID=579137 RepID=C9RES3_METVM|nr:preprotein translocase subunit SecY [Methanocaldococcus vulcanius]ACX72075.1 preprotein translocase, SecY subunit [Methanocaldococcus vulcanius M7]
MRKLIPILEKIPEVELPVREIPFKERLKWTGIVLILYFIMGCIDVYTAGAQIPAIFEFWQTITASRIGTLITLGIGPIVTAGIIMQLLVGSGLIQMDLSIPENRALFQGCQKLLSIIMCFVEAVLFVGAGAFGALTPLLALLVVLQIAFGSIILIYLDEIVSKYGIGSGIGLFIAAGVSQTIFVGAFGPEGYLWKFLGSLIEGAPNIEYIAPIIGTIIVFLMVVYAECMRVEIPLAHGRIKGAVGKYPIKFVYTSNIPVILASALFANVQLWGLALYRAGVPILGHYEGGRPIDGIAYYLSTPYGLSSIVSDPIHAIIYMIAMIITCVVFGMFWVETTGLDPKSMAKRIGSLNMAIKGFRKSEKAIEHRLKRYIPPLTVMSSAFVGFLATIANFIGALGGGTGVLLTVSIVYRMYEQLLKEKVSELHPTIAKLLNK